MILFPTAGACNGPYACASPQGGSAYHVVSDGSCIGKEACTNNIGNVSMSACAGEKACYQNQGNIGYKSCDGLVSVAFHAINMLSGSNANTDIAIEYMHG
jgi:hypothetical protein